MSIDCVPDAGTLRPDELTERRPDELEVDRQMEGWVNGGMDGDGPPAEKPWVAFEL